MKTSNRAFILALITLFLGPFLSSAQDSELDSARAAVESYPYQDTTKVNLLIDLTKYYTSRDISKTPALIEEALRISRNLNYTKGIGRALNVQSKHYIVTGELDLALPPALQAKHLFDSLKYRPGLIATHNNLARIYNVNGQFDKSLSMHLENIVLVRNDPASPDKAGMYFYVAKTYESLHKYDSAEIYYLQALKISQLSNFPTGVAIAEGSLGSIYNNLERYDEAIEYLTKTLSFSEKYDHTANIAASCFSLANSYLKLGKYPESLSYIRRSTEIYETLKNYRLLKDCYLTQSRILEGIGQLDESLRYLKLHIDLKDSVFSENKMKVIEELQTKYETEKKEIEIESLSQKSQIQELQLQKQRYGLFGLGILLFLIIGGAFLLYRQRRLKEYQRMTAIELEETKKRLAIEQQYRASELKALRSQMNPHFVFNALNSIQEYIMMNERRLAGKYLGKFADLMRTYLAHSQQKAVTVQEEVDALNLYLELEKLRFEESLDYQVSIDRSIDPDEVKLPALLIQPFVENALKHGLLHKTGERKLSIGFTLEETMLICTIKDNGIGRQASTLLNQNRNPNHKSYATGAIRERIELINYALEKPLKVETSDMVLDDGSVGGTEVKLIIPIDEFVSLEV